MAIDLGGGVVIETVERVVGETGGNSATPRLVPVSLARVRWLERPAEGGGGCAQNVTRKGKVYRRRAGRRPAP